MHVSPQNAHAIRKLGPNNVIRWMAFVQQKRVALSIIDNMPPHRIINANRIKAEWSSLLRIIADNRAQLHIICHLNDFVSWRVP